jgi:urea transport system permease protein
MEAFRARRLARAMMASTTTGSSGRAGRFARHLPFLFFGLALLAAPLALSDFRLNLLAKFLTFAMVAIGLDLLWGYGGMLSLGQGVFFGLGAYAMAMYLKLEASGDYLPDFMTWTGLKELPFFWAPFGSPVLAIGVGLIGPALVAGLLGYLVFRSRVRGVYFSIITQALALIMSTLLIGQQPVSGGTNGITNYSTIFGFPLNNPATQRNLYFVTVICLGVVYLFARWLTQGRFGRVLIAVRDDENRVRFSGYNVTLVKTLVFALSAGMAGLAGILFVPQVGIISPAALGIVPSVEMVIWVAIGGRGTLVGAVVGALLVGWAKSSFSESFPDIWQYFLGAAFIGTVVLFPKGIVGAYRQLLARRPRRSPVAQPSASFGGLPAGPTLGEEGTG